MSLELQGLCRNFLQSIANLIVQVDDLGFEVNLFEGPLAGPLTAEVELALKNVQPPSPA